MPTVVDAFAREMVEPTFGSEARTCCLRMWTLTVRYRLLRATLAGIANVHSPVCHHLLPPAVVQFTLVAHRMA